MVERLSPIVPSRGEAEETASGSFKQKPKDDAIPQSLQAKKSRSMMVNTSARSLESLLEIHGDSPRVLGDH
jgi:hypothetical protein